MQYKSIYQSPLGEILLAADDMGLTGLWFCGQKYDRQGLRNDAVMQETPILANTKRWLDIYFTGQLPDFMPDIHMQGTPFQQAVWQILRQIPYGETVTYKEIASRLARERGLSHMSAQAVGGAVGRNKISILVPCHRVVGADGSLTGYAGGMDKKQQLLALEGVDMSELFSPRRKAIL